MMFAQNAYKKAVLHIDFVYFTCEFRGRRFKVKCIRIVGDFFCGVRLRSTFTQRKLTRVNSLSAWVNLLRWGIWYYSWQFVMWQMLATCWPSSLLSFNIRHRPCMWHRHMCMHKHHTLEPMPFTRRQPFITTIITHKRIPLAMWNL